MVLRTRFTMLTALVGVVVAPLPGSTVTVASPG